MTVQHWNVDRARARWLELAGPGAVAALEADCEAAVAERRIADDVPGAHLPGRYARELENPTGESHGRDNVQLGFDGEGRVVIERRRDVDGNVGATTKLASWGDDWCEVLSLGIGAAPSSLRVFNIARGQLTEEIAVNSQRRPDGQPSVEVRRWHYASGRPTVALDTFECPIEGQWGWRARRYGFVYDTQGELEQITYCVTRGLVAGLTDVDAAQAAARVDRAGLFTTALPLYDTRPQPQEASVIPRLEVKDGASADALAALLGRALARHGIDVSGPGFDLAGDPDRLRRIWRAVQDFATAPVDDLYQGLRIPIPGAPDMDGLSLLLDTRGPVVLTFERQVYLVDSDDEHQANDAAGITVHLDMELPTTREIIEGVGGPPNAINDGARSWITAIEEHPLWTAILRSAPTGRVTWY